MASFVSRDEEGFDEAWVGVCLAEYPIPGGDGEMKVAAGYGVWFSDENASNTSGVLDSSRPQNRNAAIIHASYKALEALKKAGYVKVRVNVDTDYLNLNVLGWLKKFMCNPEAESSNWDEFKYRQEILALCAVSKGLIIKWSHGSEASAHITGLCEAKALAKKAMNTWIKDLHFHQEAAGT